MKNKMIILKLENDLKKLVKNVSSEKKSGHGTFTIAFENPIYAKL